MQLDLKFKSRFSRSIGAWLCCAVLLTASLVPASAQVTEPAHLTQANDLVDDLLVSDVNTYGTPAFITWNGTSSEAKTQCSSFITLLLKHTYGWTNSYFSSWFNSTSPNAAKYHDTIVAQNGFLRFTDVTEIEPGDIIAIKYLDGSSVSGHTMLVAEAPVLHTASSPVISDTTQYTVTVVDSSSSYHGSGDTRYGNPGGIGRGTFRLYVDAGNQVVGYTWSTFSNSQYYTPSERDLVVGRLP